MFDGFQPNQHNHSKEEIIMKRSRKFLCALLAAALLVLSVMPAYAAVEVNWGAKKVYMGSSDGSDTSGYSVSIDGIKSSTKITSIKSAKKSILKPSSLDRWSSKYKSLDSDYTSEYHDASIYFSALKAGKSKLSFKVDGKSYSGTVEVLAYKNPLKTFKITGISSSNLKSKFAKSSWVSAKLKSNAKSGKITAAAASGWKVTEVRWSGNGHSREYSYSDGVSSISLPVPKMTTGNYYYIYIYLRNTKNNLSQSLTYRLEG